MTERFFFKAWREYAGFSQRQLAEALGVTHATISRVENGKRDFTGDYLVAFAKVCGCQSPGDPVSRPPLAEREKNVIFVDFFAKISGIPGG